MFWIRTIAPLALAGLVGCGDGDRIKLVPVKGTVTLDGNPLAQANVVFHPNPQNADQTAGADVTGPKGNFTAIYQGRLGLAPGKYKVMVTPSQGLPPGFKAPPGMEDDVAEARKALHLDPVYPGAKPKVVVKGYEIVPPTDFDAEVSSTGGDFTFDVKSPSSSNSMKAKK